MLSSQGLRNCLESQFTPRSSPGILAAAHRAKQAHAGTTAQSISAMHLTLLWLFLYIGGPFFFGGGCPCNEGRTIASISYEGPKNLGNCPCHGHDMATGTFTHISTDCRDRHAEHRCNRELLEEHMNTSQEPYMNQYVSVYMHIIHI